MWQAGALSLLVHGIFLTLLVMTLSWKSVTPMQVAEVQLWDSLPTPKTVESPKPVPKVEPPPTPKIESKPEQVPEPKAEIQLKPKLLAKPKPEPKPAKKPKEEAPKPDPKLQARKEEEKRLEDLKRAMLAEDDPSQAQKHEAQQVAEARAAQTQAASSGDLDKYRAQIQSKIRRFVNRQVCGSGKPVLEFGLTLMPTGEVVGTPHLQKSSGIAACDQAVERAILQAQPLPVPREPELFAQLRDLNLKFRPNDDN